jgi:hypothetical protein
LETSLSFCQIQLAAGDPFPFEVHLDKLFAVALRESLGVDVKVRFETQQDKWKSTRSRFRSDYRLEQCFLSDEKVSLFLMHIAWDIEVEATKEVMT